MLSLGGTGKGFGMDVALSLDRVSALTEEDLAAVRALSQSVYPPTETADWPGRHLEWAEPEWCVRVCEPSGQLVSYVGVLLRNATYDGLPVRVGGVGGIMTHPATRRRGYARRGILEAEKFFREQGSVAFALLVCNPRLLAYYASVGWREFVGELWVVQTGSSARFTFNRIMTFGISGEAPAAGTIDPGGPPW